MICSWSQQRAAPSANSSSGIDEPGGATSRRMISILSATPSRFLAYRDPRAKLRLMSIGSTTVWAKSPSNISTVSYSDRSTSYERSPSAIRSLGNRADPSGSTPGGHRRTAGYRRWLLLRSSTTPSQSKNNHDQSKESWQTPGSLCWRKIRVERCDRAGRRLKIQFFRCGRFLAHENLIARRKVSYRVKCVLLPGLFLAKPSPSRELI